MNIALCIAWFVFGFIVGQLVLVSIALIIYDKENKDGKRIQECSNNYVNKDKQ